MIRRTLLAWLRSALRRRTKDPFHARDMRRIVRKKRFTLSNGERTF